MKTHIRRVHENNAEKAEFILIKFEVIQRENRGYLDPGLYSFKGDCINGAVTTVTQDLCGQEEDLGSNPTAIAATQNHQEENEEDSPASKAVTLVDREARRDTQGTEASTKKRKLSLLEYRERETSNQHTTGTQTTWKNLPTLYLPNIPEADNTEELQSCLVWLCNRKSQGISEEEVRRRPDGSGEEKRTEKTIREEEPGAGVRVAETKSYGQTVRRVNDCGGSM